MCGLAKERRLPTQSIELSGWAAFLEKGQCRSRQPGTASISQACGLFLTGTWILVTISSGSLVSTMLLM